MLLYVIHNAVTGMEYVGTTTRSLSLRMSDHRYRAKSGGRPSPLYEAIREHGIAQFTMQLLDVATSYEELLEKEQRAIRERNTLHPHGYNLVAGGRGNYGWRMKPETRRKIAEKATGRVSSMRGRKMSPEARARMSAQRKGKFTDAQRAAARRTAQSSEVRAKLRTSALARWGAMSAEQRQAKTAHLDTARDIAIRSHTPEGNARVAELKRAWWASLSADARQHQIAAMKAGQRNAWLSQH